MIRLYCVQLKLSETYHQVAVIQQYISMDLQCQSEFDAKGLMVYLHSQQGLTRNIELRNVISVQVSQNSNTYVKQHKAGHKLPYKAEFSLFQQHKRLKHTRANGLSLYKARCIYSISSLSIFWWVFEIVLSKRVCV